MMEDEEEARAYRSWAEVDLGTILRNYEIYKESLPEPTEVMAVVKADAYGHGDREVAGTLADAGVRYFAVSNIDEAEHIREAVAEGLILILGYTPVSEVARLARSGVVQALLSEDYAALLLKAAEKAGVAGKLHCQFAIDTGMNRIGLDAEDPKHCGEVIRSYKDSLGINGIFTHLCVADADTAAAEAFTRKQIALYNGVREEIRDLALPYCSCLNSAGGRTYANTGNAYTRLGIILYGLKPDRENTLPAGIRPALSWKAEVSLVKQVYPGETIGYGRTFRADHEMRIATVSVGYADGYRRSLSNRGDVLIHGKRARITGRICMDQMLVDVTDIPDVRIGDTVTLLGTDGTETITADDMAALTDTIGYEILCGISKRVPRIYHKD